MENKINCGRRLKQLRTKQGLTLSELSTELNNKYGVLIHKGIISKWENNINDPSFYYATIIADYFKIDLEDLIRDI